MCCACLSRVTVMRACLPPSFERKEKNETRLNTHRNRHHGRIGCARGEGKQGKKLKSPSSGRFWKLRARREYVRRGGDRKS